MFRDGLTCMLSDSVSGELSDIAMADALNNSPTDLKESNPSSDLCIVPCDIPQVLQSPFSNVLPRVLSRTRKCLRTSSMLTASPKDQSCDLDQEGLHASSSKLQTESTSCALTAPNIKSGLSTTECLADRLHHGLEIIGSHQHNAPLRYSQFRFSFKPAELKPILPAERVDVGVQTLLEDGGLSDEVCLEYLCTNCKRRTLQGELKEANENSSLQLVLVNGSLSSEKSKNRVSKVVEKVLMGAIRREMALQESCAKQTSEIMQLNCLVQQYKHERERNAIIGQMQEDKIIRLENLMAGVLPTEDFLKEELISLQREHELLKENYDNHPDVLWTKIVIKRVQDESDRYRNFIDMGERDILLEEIQDLRTQLKYYVNNSSKPAQWRSSVLQLTYSGEQSSSPPPFCIIQELSKENAEAKLEQEKLHWTEVESKWISLAEELRVEKDSSRTIAEKLKQELESEKKCSEEMKEALQLAMEGHARMLEHYVELEEKHMQLLARHRKIQEGIDDVKRAASRAGVKGAESKFINAIAAQISALKVAGEKDRQYLRAENQVLRAQLRDTSEAVEAAGELLVHLKEAEEAAAASQKRVAAAEEETEKTHKQIDKLKRKYEKEV